MLEAPVLLHAERPQDVLESARIVRDGGLVVIPTDTVYGLAASVFRPEAVARVFRVKARPVDSAVPLLLPTATDLPILVSDIPAMLWKLIDRYWPGPLTLVMPARPSLISTVTGGGSTVGVRVPGSRSCLEFLQTLGEPVVGTSANLHGVAPALTAGEALTQLGSKVDAVLEDDKAVVAGVSSTVVELLGERCVVHREGAIPTAEILETLGLGYGWKT